MSIWNCREAGPSIFEESVNRGHRTRFPEHALKLRKADNLTGDRDPRDPRGCSEQVPKEGSALRKLPGTLRDNKDGQRAVTSTTPTTSYPRYLVSISGEN
jgi:hypothetical protein